MHKTTDEYKKLSIEETLKELQTDKKTGYLEAMHKKGSLNTATTNPLSGEPILLAEPGLGAASISGYILPEVCATMPP